MGPESFPPVNYFVRRNRSDGEDGRGGVVVEGGGGSRERRAGGGKVFEKPVHSAAF